MKSILPLLVIVAVAIQGTAALGAGLDAGAYVSQVSGGVTTTSMSMEDLLAPVKNLAGNLPHMKTGQGNYSLVLQNGDFNNVAILQSGLHNASMVAQTGYQNSAYIQQFGSGHQSFVIQNGFGNNASVTQR